MKTLLVLVSVLSLAAFPPGFAGASDDSSFESQVFQTQKDLMPAIKLAHEGGKAQTASTSKARRTKVRVDIEWFAWDVVRIKIVRVGEVDPAGEISGEKIMNKDVFRFSGFLNAATEHIFIPGYTKAFSLKGPGVNIKVGRYSFRGYEVMGTYEKPNSSPKATVPVYFGLEPTGEGWKVHQDGVDLRIFHEVWNEFKVFGWVNEEKFGTFEMGILGTCVAVLTFGW